MQCDHSYEYMEFAEACPAQVIPLRVRANYWTHASPVVMEVLGPPAWIAPCMNNGHGLAVTAADLKNTPSS